jgi:TolC family type I secretion outer membrane protein
MIFRILTLLGLAACLALAAAGCRTVREAREVQRGGAPLPGERSLRAADAGLVPDAVLSLDRALQLALATHPALLQAAQELAAATAQVRQARAAYWPALDASAGYTRSTANNTTDRAAGSHDTFSASLGLDLLIYDFGKTPAAVRQAYARQTAAAETLAVARGDRILAVRAAYFEVCKAQELTRVAEESVRQYEAHLSQVRAFLEVGRRTRYDLTKSEVDLGNARLDLIKARNGMADARATLDAALGLAEPTAYAVVPATLPPVTATAESLLATLRTNHPALRAILAGEQAASSAVDEAIADLYPALALRGQYGAAGRALPLVWNWSLSALSSLPLFTGGRQLARIEEATARLRQARARRAEREQQLYQELVTALNQYAGAREQLAVTDLLVRQARESLDLIDERYRLGAASAVEVTDAQVALTGARASQVKARFEGEIATARVRHAMGEHTP